MPRLTDDQIKHMVNRFLSWRLPESWSPDGGISFTPDVNAGTNYSYKHHPTGTNLFTATQAEVMVRYMLEDDAQPRAKFPNADVRPDGFPYPVDVPGNFAHHTGPVPVVISAEQCAIWNAALDEAISRLQAMKVTLPK